MAAITVIITVDPSIGERGMTLDTGAAQYSLISQVPILGRQPGFEPVVASAYPGCDILLMASNLIIAAAIAPQTGGAVVINRTSTLAWLVDAFATTVDVSDQAALSAIVGSEYAAAPNAQAVIGNPGFAQAIAAAFLNVTPPPTALSGSWTPLAPAATGFSPGIS